MRGSWGESWSKGAHGCSPEMGSCNGDQHSPIAEAKPSGSERLGDKSIVI